VQIVIFRNPQHHIPIYELRANSFQMYTAKELFFNEAQETFAIFDKNLNFLEVNEALLRSLHLKKEQVIGKNVREISPGIYTVKHAIKRLGGHISLQSEEKAGTTFSVYLPNETFD
jgi:PAS domain S-box-containing protein